MMEKVVQYPEIPNIPADPEMVKLYGYDPDRDAAYAEMEAESFEREPFLIPGYIYKDHEMIPIPRIKKRIGSKLYDTNSSECLGTIEGGILFRKKTRDREYFAVMDDGEIRPLDVYDPVDVALMETGKAIRFEDPEPKEYRVRIDGETYHRIEEMARAEGISMAQVVRRLAAG